MKKKIIILLIVVLLVISCFVLGYLSKNNNKNNKQTKKNDTVLSVKKYKSLEFTSINLYRSDNLTHLTMLVTNKGGSDFNGETVKLSFYDENNNMFYSKNIVLQDLEKGKTASIDVIVDKDVFDSKNFKISAS